MKHFTISTEGAKALKNFPVKKAVVSADSASQTIRARIEPKK
jgi:hypothetical protein